MPRRIGLSLVLLVLVPYAMGQDVESGVDATATALPKATAFDLPDRSLVSSTSSVAKLVSLHYELDDRQSLSVSTELLKVASFYFEYRGFEEQPVWKFKGVPLTISYERVLADPSRRIVPVVGVGVSYYLAQMKQRTPGEELDALSFDESIHVKRGMGWGAQATWGIRTTLTDRSFLQLQGRYRLIDGFGFTGDEYGAARFGVFDFVVGIGFKL